ncbi:MAG: hypothetical protein J1E85_10100 [Ruminococcus sp.]|nr:hypothetical protein [Ruminococcus sp.]
MRIMKLYTGGGVSLSPQHSDGRTLSDYVRLVADDDKAITNDNIVTTCIDVPLTDIDKWKDCDIEEIAEQEIEE